MEDGAEGFIINNFECDFVVVVLLNRGSKDGKVEKKAPEYFVIPVDVVKALPRTEGWGKISFSKFTQLQFYGDKWDQLRDVLGSNGNDGNGF